MQIPIPQIAVGLGALAASTARFVMLAVAMDSVSPLSRHRSTPSNDIVTTGAGICKNV